MSNDSKQTGLGVSDRGHQPIALPHAQIASKLKSFYTSVEQDPIPDAFLDLLEKLDQAERQGKTGF